MLNWHSRVVDVSLNGLNLVCQFTNHSVSFVGLFYMKNGSLPIGTDMRKHNIFFSGKSNLYQ